MVRAEGNFIIAERLRFIFFGLECALNVEFDASATEQVFTDVAGYEDGVDCSEKRYTFYSSPRLRVTGEVDEYEELWFRLIIESKRAIEPSLAEIAERSEYQVLRWKRWQEAREPAV